MEYTEVLAKVSFFLIKVPKLTNLRSRDLAKIGHIAYPANPVVRLSNQTVSTKYDHSF